MKRFSQKVLDWLGHHAWAGIGSIVGILALVISLVQLRSGPEPVPTHPGSSPVAESASGPEAGYVLCGGSTSGRLRSSSGRPGRLSKGDYVQVVSSVKVFSAARDKADVLGVWKEGTRLKAQSFHGSDWCYFIRMGG